MNLRHILLAAAITASWLPAQGVQASVAKQVRDWSVSCSNGLTCNVSHSDWKAKGIQYVGFQRNGGRDAPISLRLRAARNFSPDEDPDIRYRFAVDGKELFVLAAKELTQEEHSEVYFYADQSRVLALMAAMKAGQTAAVTIEGKAGSQVMTFKLEGMKDTLLYVDEVQSRLGRRDALEAKGEKEPPRNAGGKDILTLEDMPEIVRKDFTDSGGACSDLEPETIKHHQGFDVTVGSVRLIGVPCATGGVYNQPYALYVVNEIVERISFPYMDGGKPTAMASAMNIDFDPVTRTMTSFFIGRGLGDCGEYFKWQLDERGGRLKLLEMRNKPDCDEGDNDPTKFPLIWKAGQ